MLIPLVQITSCGIGLPDFDQRFANRTTIFIQHLPADNNALAEWLTLALSRQIERTGGDDALSGKQAR